MPKAQVKSAADTAFSVIFFIFVSLALLSPLWVFKDLLFPFITSKAFTFRAFVELAFPCYLYLFIKRPDLRPSRRNPLVWFLLAFLAVSFIASLAGVNVTRSLWGNFERMGGVYYLAHLTMLSLYVVMLARIGGNYVKYILYVALGVAALVTLNGVSGWLGGPIMVPDPSLPDRVSSTLGNPIFLGSFLMLPTFLAAFFALQQDSLGKKIGFWLLTGLLFVGIVLSVTRGAGIGLIVGCFSTAAVFIVLHPRREVKIYGSAIWLVLFASVLSLFVFNAKLPQNRITRLFNLTLQGGDTQARFLQWRAALRGFRDYPVLGVGPENYYFISNKYYNPQIVKYDPSWFDKPHNYVLEVLVTTGLPGYAAYMAVILLVGWALYRAFRSGFLSLLQMCLLLAGFASYFVQNLFVFDTIPASLMFFVFVGFALYLWDESAASESPSPQFRASQNQPALAASAAAVGAVVMLYAVYLTNIVPAQAARNVNYGYAYNSVDANKAFAYFESAINSPFNFDLQDTAQRFSDLAAVLAQSQQVSPDASKQMIGQITDFEKQVAQSIGNDPVSWQKLANDYYIQALVNQKALDPSAEYAIKRAVALVPNRIEPDSLLAQIYAAENRPNEGVAELQRLNRVVPLTAYTASSRWLLAYLEHLSGQDAQGAGLAEQMVSQNYQPQNFQVAGWVFDYYSSQKDYKNSIVWGQRLIKLFPSQSSVYLALAQVYAQTGQVQPAKDLLQKLIDSNAPNKQAAEDLLKTLPK